ncbi:Lactose-binding protein [subsurface metagenome]
MGGIIEIGGLLDITDKIQPYIDDLAVYKMKDAKKDDSYYAVPWDGAPVAMFYRRDVFEEAGLASDPETVTDLVSTWDKYYEVAKTIKDATGKFMQPQSKANNNGRFLEILLWQRGLGYIDDEGKVAINSPGAVEALEFIGMMVSEGLYADEIDWTDPWYAQFASIDESGASCIEASWMGGCFKTWLAPDTAGLWGIVLMPALEEGGVRASADGGSSFVIPEQSQNIEAAWALIEYALLRDQGVIDCYTAGGYTPSLVTSYGADEFTAEDPFFAGQVPGPMFNEINENIPAANVYSAEYAEMNSLTVPEIQKYLTGQQTAQEALDNAAAAIRAATGRQ